MPELRGKPVAVVPVMTDSTCAIAASYEAKAYGVKTGTMIYEAKRRCPGLICVQARHDAYVDFHHKILASIEHHYPISQILSIDEVACKLDAHRQVPERAIALAKAMKAGITRDIGPYVRCSIGIAPNRFLAKVASNLQKPDGLTLLGMDELPERLLPLALTDLPGIGRGMKRRLERCGITTMAQLWALPPKQMRAIWGGVGGERFWRMLHGLEVDDIPTRRRTIGHSHVLSPEWRPQPQARLVTRRLLSKTASRLRRMEYHATKMELSLRVEHGPRLHAIRSFHRACDTHSLLHVVESMWEELTHPLESSIRIKKASVTLHGLIANRQVQPDLFDDPSTQEDGSAQRSEALSHAIDALNSKFGRDTVTIGSLPKQLNSFSGTKIAFTRIPDKQEFHE